MMDELKIQSDFMKSLFSSIISRKLNKKLKNPCDAKVHKLGIINNGEKTTLSIAMDLEVNTTDIPKVLKELGIM